MDEPTNPTTGNQPGAPVAGWSPPPAGGPTTPEPAQTPGWTPTPPPAAPTTPDEAPPAGGPAPIEPTPTTGWTPTPPPAAPATPEPAAPAAGGDGTPGTGPVGTV